MFSTFKSLGLAALLFSVSSSATASKDFVHRRSLNTHVKKSVSTARQLADGTSMQYGKIKSKTDPLYGWQSSGILDAGGCEAVGIANCYHIHLDATGNLQRRTADQDHLEKRASSRQRVEFYGGTAVAGETRTYTWKQYISKSYTGSSGWVHISQIKNAGVFPLISANLGTDYATITNDVTDETVAQIPLSSYLGRTAQHTLQVKYGSSGKLNYTITDFHTGDTLLKYYNESDDWTEGYIKHGFYREYVQPLSVVDAYIGDYQLYENWHV